MEKKLVRYVYRDAGEGPWMIRRCVTPIIEVSRSWSMAGLKGLAGFVCYMDGMRGQGGGREGKSELKGMQCSG